MAADQESLGGDGSFHARNMSATSNVRKRIAGKDQSGPYWLLTLLIHQQYFPKPAQIGFVLERNLLTRKLRMRIMASYSPDIWRFLAVQVSIKCRSEASAQASEKSRLFSMQPTV